jgi:hypothetical protein
MPPLRLSWLPSFIVACALALACAQPAFAIQLCQGPIDPNSLKVEGLINPLRISKVAPLFQWTHPGPGQQTTWQVQLDSEPNFPGGLWFWESGTADKGSLNSANQVHWGAIFPSGNFPRPLDTRADLIYWRVRTQNNNDSTWSSDPTRFSCGVMKLNQIPLPPGDVTVFDDNNPGGQSAAFFPPLVTSPGQFFVSTSGSDTNPGTISQPYRTINRGVRDLRPGDILNIRAGTYGENVQITQSRGIVSGTPGNPITVRKYPGDTGAVLIRGGTSGPQPLSTISIIGSSAQAIDYWIIDGLTISGSGVSVGVYVYIANHNTLRNLRFDPGFNPNGVGVRLQGTASDNMILDSIFNQPMYYQLEVTSAQHTIVRGNEFTNGNSWIVISFHSSASFAGIIEDNIIHDTSALEGAIQLYLSGDGAVVRNNLFYNISERTNGNTAAVQIMRSGKVLIENNTMVNTKRGVSFLEFSRFITVRNNIIANSQIGLDFNELSGSPPGSTAVGAELLYNYVYNNQTDIIFRFPSDDPLVTKIGNCFGGSCNPMFVNAGAHDYRLQAGSPAIDAGDPNTPVPVGGGGRVDVGAYESGATRPYDWQPKFSTGDITPRITWNLRDPDNFLNAFDPNSFPGTDSQTAFEVEIDSSPRFNSVNGSRPIFSSGVIMSGTAGYTVPNSHQLVPGTYYVRVRQRDNHQQGGMGAWSNNNIRFSIQSEPQSPTLTQQSPVSGAQAVAQSATVSAHVVDYGSGIDQSTIMMHLGVDDPNTPMQVVPQVTTVTPPSQEYALSYSPPAGTFTSGSTIYVRIQALDNFGSPPLDSTWSFLIVDTVAPPIPSNLMVIP